MSDQPLYVVVENIRATTIAMRDDEGCYRTVCQMVYPFDQSETALQLCDVLTAMDERLEVADPAKKP